MQPEVLLAWSQLRKYSGGGAILSCESTTLSASSSSSTIGASISGLPRVAHAQAAPPVRATLRRASYTSQAAVDNFLRLVSLARLRLRSSFSRTEAASKTKGLAPGIALLAVGSRTGTVGAKVALDGAPLGRAFVGAVAAAALMITSGSTNADPVAVKKGDGELGALLGGESGNMNWGGAPAFC